MPIICVAIYEDDALPCIAPCADTEQTYTVEDCLTALEAGITEPFAGQESLSEDRPEATLKGTPEEGE